MFRACSGLGLRGGAGSRMVLLLRARPENPSAAFTAYITNRTFDYDFEHTPVTPPNTDLV